MCKHESGKSVATANESWVSVEEGYSTQEEGQEEDDEEEEDAPPMENLEDWRLTQIWRGFLKIL